MEAEQFKKMWNEFENNLSPLPQESLSGLILTNSSKNFLTVSGLPESAAPFLSFCQNTIEFYNSINRLNVLYDIPEPEYERYIVIGSCGDGDPIAIDNLNQDQVFRLDHEDYFSPHFFNTSIHLLAECLIIYRDFILTIQKENGDDAYFNCNFSDEQLEDLKQKLTLADKDAMQANCFWLETLETDLANRNYFMNSDKNTNNSPPPLIQGYKNVWRGHPPVAGWGLRAPEGFRAKGKKASCLPH